MLYCQVQLIELVQLGFYFLLSFLLPNISPNFREGLSKKGDILSMFKISKKNLKGESYFKVNLFCKFIIFNLYNLPLNFSPS